MNDVTPEGKGGEVKNGNFGRFSRLNWGDKGRGVKKLEIWGDVIYG